eukprot:2303708-Rhodomonas_salina.1
MVARTESRAGQSQLTPSSLSPPLSTPHEPETPPQAPPSPPQLTPESTEGLTEVEREEGESTEVSTEVEREEAESTEVLTVERSRLRCQQTRRGRGSLRSLRSQQSVLSYTVCWPVCQCQCLSQGAHFHWAGRQIRPCSLQESGSDTATQKGNTVTVTTPFRCGMLVR